MSQSNNNDCAAPNLMTRQLRIVCLTTRFSTGGAELDALLLAEAAQKRGYDAELWSLYKAGDLACAHIKSRIALQHKPRHPGDLFKIYKGLCKAIADFKPDVILSFQPLSNILGAISLNRKGRFVASQRNPSESQRIIIRIIEGMVGSTSLYSKNIMISQSVLDSYRRYLNSYKEKSTIIYNGLPDLPSIVESKAEARAILNLPQNVHMIGNIARLHHQKNQEFLIRLVHKMPDVHLMLAGDGPDEPQLREQAKSIRERVHFIGRVQEREVALCYRALDIFAFPSRYEGFGRSPLEAMSMRIPVIAHDIPIMREVIGDAGILLPLNLDDWCRCIINILGGRYVSLELAEKHARSFSLDAMIDNYMQALLPAQREP